jgi:hypothetical protein
MMKAFSGLINALEITEERMSELEDLTIELSNTEKKRERKKKKSQPEQNS